MRSERTDAHVPPMKLGRCPLSTCELRGTHRLVVAPGEREKVTSGGRRSEASGWETKRDRSWGRHRVETGAGGSLVLSGEQCPGISASSVNGRGP